MKLDCQPRGAGGHYLGVEGILALQVTVEKAGITQSVPCYILDSSKPIWQGELNDCGVVIGTNALAKLGFNVVDSHGDVVGDSTSEATDGVPDKKTDPPDQMTVELEQNLHLGPQQTRVARVKVSGDKISSQNSEIGVVSPSESALSNKAWNFVEGYWTGEQEFNIPITNWGMESIVLEKGSTVGQIDTVSLVEHEDPVWEEMAIVARIDPSSELGASRGQQLEAQLDIGEKCTTEQRAAIVQLMKERQGVFALTDSELGQTDLVEHSIQMEDHTPIKTSPR